LVAGQCHIAWNALTSWNPVTRNGGKYNIDIYCILYYLLREYLTPFLVTGFQAFQLVRAFQAMLHWPACNHR